jgi:translation initiation factor IF-1
MRRILTVAFLLGLGASPLLAHGGGPHFKGTISAITADQITVESTDGHVAVAKITPDTRFVRGKVIGKREDLKRGDRVVVHTRKQGDTLEAVEIRYRAGGAVSR